MRGLSATSIKLIAAAAMLLDHIAWLWFPENTAPGFIMHTIGRITAPIMCYFIAEGYYRTRNVGRYALRLFIFAVISQIPYHYFMTGNIAFMAIPAYANLSGMYNMIFTLLLGLAALHVMNLSRIPRAARLLLIALCCAATYFCDWLFFGVLFILAFGARHGNKRRQAELFVLICAALIAFVLMAAGPGAGYTAGVLLALPLLLLYNGERGGGRGAVGKYAFYAFYPLHLLILALLKYCLHV